MERGDRGDRGERGPAGDKGAHGQGGDSGLQGFTGERGDTGAKGERGDTGPAGKSSVLSRHVSISFLLLTLVATAVLLVMGYTIHQNRGLIHQNRALILQGAAQQAKLKALALSTHNSLCSLRGDLQRRHDTSVVYLEAHPRGVVSPVTNAIIITSAEIQQAIASQNITLKALSGLNCQRG